MARLGPDITDFDYDFRNFKQDTFDALQKRFEKMLSESDNIIRFPVADGYAFYQVASEKPLVLRYILWCDNYREHPALIRGLRLADVRDMLRREAWLKETFGAR